ncbi:hypothetical protein L915_14163, partial [Phytophthora nicotianae]
RQMTHHHICMLTTSHFHVNHTWCTSTPYSAGTKVNLISQTYMQFTCGFKLVMSDDQLVTWLVKPNLKLKFVLRDGLYRMRVQPSSTGTGRSEANRCAKRNGTAPIALEPREHGHYQKDGG